MVFTFAITKQKWSNILSKIYFPPLNKRRASFTSLLFFKPLPWVWTLWFLPVAQNFYPTIFYRWINNFWIYTMILNDLNNHYNYPQNMDSVQPGASRGWRLLQLYEVHKGKMTAMHNKYINRGELSLCLADFQKFFGYSTWYSILVRRTNLLRRKQNNIVVAWNYTAIVIIIVQVLSQKKILRIKHRLNFTENTKWGARPDICPNFSHLSFENYERIFTYDLVTN